MVVQLRRQRKERGWTLDDVAEQLHRLAREMGEPVPGVDRQAVSRWEHGTHRPRPYYVRLLSALFEASPSQLGLVDSPQEEHVIHKLDASASEDARRRDFLRLTETAAIGAGSTDPGAPTSMVGGPSSLDARGLSEALGHSLAGAWTQFQVADSEMMLTVANAQLFILTQHHGLLEGTGALPSLYSAGYRLVGATLHRQSRYQEALHAHNQAYLTALEGCDPWNMAQSRTWQAYGLRALGRHSDSLQALQAALRLASEDDQRSTRLRARLLTTAAEQAAALGDQTEVAVNLDASEELLEHVPALDEEFDQVAWLESAGICALRLGQPDLAAARLQKAAEEGPVHWIPRYVLVRIGLGKALLATGDRDAALATSEVILPQLKLARSRELDHYFVDFLHRGLLVHFGGDERCRRFADEAHRFLVRDDD